MAKELWETASLSPSGWEVRGRECPDTVKTQSFHVLSLASHKAVQSRLTQIYLTAKSHFPIFYEPT